MVGHAFEPLICSAIAEGDNLLVYAVSDLLRKQQGKLKLTVYTLNGQTVNTITKTIAIPANTSTLILEQPLAELLKSQQREDVVVSMELTTSSGVSYQANCFLCLQKDLRLSPVKPEVSVEAAEGGCLITLKADKFVRALALSIDGAEDCWFDNNYIDLLPGVPVKCFVRTSLSSDEVKKRLRLHCLNHI
jgi:beta-mannosidase